jgi:GDP-L-fucose synthase
MNKKVLVIGGAGFLGTNLIQLLNTTSKYDVVSTGRKDRCNLLDLSQTTSKLKSTQPDIIINLAAHVGSLNYVTHNHATVIDDNVKMYLNLYKAISCTCPTVKVINTISNCSYAGHLDIQSEKDWWGGMLHPSVISFASSKLLLWATGECYRSQYGTKSISVILPNAYGINDPSTLEQMHAMNGIMVRMIKAKRNNEKTFTIWGTGSPIREWIYMPDAAKILMECIDREFDVTYFNAAQKRGISIVDSAKIIAKVMNYNVEFIFDTSKTDGAPIKILDNVLFRKYFPDFQFTPYEVGITNTIKYFDQILP